MQVISIIITWSRLTSNRDLTNIHTQNLQTYNILCSSANLFNSLEYHLIPTHDIYTRLHTHTHRYIHVHTTSAVQQTIFTSRSFTFSQCYFWVCRCGNTHVTAHLLHTTYSVLHLPSQQNSDPWTQAKPSQSSKWGQGLARSAIRRPPVCWPFQRLIALLGSIRDTLNKTGEYAYANDFEVRLRALTD